MDIKTFIEGGKFDHRQHFAVVTRGQGMKCMLPEGGGLRDSVMDRFGNREIKHVMVYENIIRVEV